MKVAAAMIIGLFTKPGTGILRGSVFVLFLRFKIFIMFLIFIISDNIAFAQPATYKRVKLEATAESVAAIQKSGLVIDYIGDDGIMTLEISNNELELLKNTGLSFEILIDDLEGFYSRRNLGKDPKAVTDEFRAVKEYNVPQGFSLGSMGGYCTYNEMLDHLDTMHNDYPGLITEKDTIGNLLTIEGRPVFQVKISDNPDIDEEEPEVLYTALIHAREPGSMQLLLFYMYNLLENYAVNTEIQQLVDNTEMYFILCTNPDGYIYNQGTNPLGGGMWRKNRRNNGNGSYGVDLNRNFGYMWGYDNIGSSAVPSASTYRGASAFSEPETKIIRDFCNQHEFSVAINFHTYGNLMLHPWGYSSTVVNPENDYFETIGKIMTSKNNYRLGVPGEVLYSVNGDVNDWMYGEEISKPKIYGFTPEVGTDYDGFWPSMDRIIPHCIENLHLCLSAARIAGGYWLTEDTEPAFLTSHNGSLSWKIQRLGLTPEPVAVTIVPNSGHFMFLGDQKMYNDVEMTQIITDSLPFTLRHGIQPGEQIRYVIKTESESFSESDTIIKYFGTPVTAFFDHCSSKTNWESTSWNITAENYHSPYSAITDSPNSTYPNNANSYITLKQPVDLRLSQAAVLTFFTRWRLDGGHDWVSIEATSDSGQTWIPLKGKLSGTGIVTGNPNLPVYFGKRDSWSKEEIDLTAFCGNWISLRFRLVTDNATRKDGFYVDDLLIEKIEESPATQTLIVEKGWNDISSFLIPDNDEMTAIFESNGTLPLYLTDGYRFYEPGNPAGTLFQWDSHSGYMAKFADQDTLTIEGFPESFYEVVLGEGWHLIPVLSAIPVGVADLMIYPPGAATIIRESTGLKVWWPEKTIFSLDTLLPGKSYIIQMISEGYIQYPKTIK